MTEAQMLSDLHNDARRFEKARVRRSKILAAIGAAVFLVLCVDTATAIQNNRIGHDTRRTAERMADCTVKGGDCYEDGTKRTGAAVTSIVTATIRGVVAGIACGRSTTTDDALQRCVTDKLKAR